MHEVWKDIPGYEGYYQISNIGNVRSLDREFVNSIGRSCFLKGVCIKLKTEKGYYRIGLKRHQESKRFSVHRLVAMAFLPNPQSHATVNHINGVKTGNRVENLEWCTAAQNISHAYQNNLSGCLDKSIARI